MTVDRLALKRAIDYAERHLQVQAIWDESERLEKLLKTSLDEELLQRQAIRVLESQILDYEMEIRSDIQGSHPEYSVAALDRTVKMALFENDRLTEMRRQLASLRGKLDTAEANVKACSAGLSVRAARMVQVGGYLQYLAVAGSQVDTTTRLETSE